MDGFDAKAKGIKISVMVMAVNVKIKDTYTWANILYNFSEYTAKLTPRLWEEWEICPKEKTLQEMPKMCLWAKIMRTIIRLLFYTSNFNHDMK